MPGGEPLQSRSLQIGLDLTVAVEASDRLLVGNPRACLPANKTKEAGVGVGQAEPIILRKYECSYQVDQIYNAAACIFTIPNTRRSM